jgi:PAS domain-containing protein
LFDQTKKEIEAHGQLDELDTGNNATNKKLLTRCLDAIDVMNFKIIKLRERLVIGLEPVKTNFRRAQDGLTRLGGNTADKRRKLPKDLRELSANFLGAVDGKVTKFRERLRGWLKPVKAHFRRAQDGRTRLGRPADKSRKLRTRENDLRKLLANSPDAVVVTSTNRRFVAANPKGLSLFGISETNMTMFTLDVFLPCVQLPRFDENGAPFLNRKERHGECEIRRLDGSLRVAEFVFVANYVPFLHVFRFQNDRKWSPRKRLAA